MANSRLGKRSWGPVTRMQAAWRRFVGDTVGSTGVQALMLMPAIIFAFACAVILWQTVNVRRSMHYGTYQAVRYLSLYPSMSTLPTDWEDIASKFIDAEMRSNPWVRTPLNAANFDVDVTLFDGNACGDEFEVRVAYKLFTPTASRGSIGLGAILPGLELVTMREVRRGKLVCSE